MINKNLQKGVSLYLVIIILSVVLAIVLGLTAVLVGQLKMIRGVENSVVAFYGADTGVEIALKDVYSYLSEMDQTFPSDDGDGDYGFFLIGAADDININVNVVCCSYGVDCKWEFGVNECPVGPPAIIRDDNCRDSGASYFCIRSVGTYSKTKRALEIGL